ncbi:MAG: hypothetical protein ACREEL_07480 [Stellaceae bacterium]
MPNGAFQTGQIAIVVERFQKCGIDPAPLLDAMAGRVASINSLSREVLAHAREYQTASASRDRRRASKGKSGAAAEEARGGMGLTPVRGEGRLPQSVVGFFITLMIEACACVDVAPPKALAQLVRAHLGADTFAIQQLKAPDAFDKAARYKLAYPDAGQDEIARHAGVSRPRVSQWIKNGSLERTVERLGKLRGAADLIRSTTPRRHARNRVTKKAHPYGPV